MDFERAPDVEAVMVEMKSSDIAAEEALELALLAEDETAHSRMKAVGAKYESKCVLAAVIERDVDRTAGVAKRSYLAAETDGDATRDGSVVKNALEIRAAKIDIVPAKRATYSVDGSREPDGAFAIHELELIDRVVDGAKLGL
ncbi:MAG TPA: hypothetical protein VFP29_07010 [Methyloceanibacter sp.]|nr:hypothetical protein [Methyloceanibacter sp.]